MPWGVVGGWILWTFPLPTLVPLARRKRRKAYWLIPAASANSEALMVLVVAILIPYLYSYFLTFTLTLTLYPYSLSFILSLY